MFPLVIVIPELGCYEDILSFHDSFVDCAFDALTSFFFVLVVVRSIEESVARFNGLNGLSLVVVFSNIDLLCCTQCLLLGLPELSKVQSPPEAWYALRLI